MWKSFKKDGKWVEGVYHERIRVDAYLFDKALFNAWAREL